MDGAFAEYCLVDVASAAVIPEGMSFEQAATFSCAGVTIYHSVKKAAVKPGGVSESLGRADRLQVLAISGMGALGMLGVQMAKTMVSADRGAIVLSFLLQGIKVVGIDAREGPCKAAASVKYKPDIIVNATETPAEEVVAQIDALRNEDWDLGHGADGEPSVYVE